MMSFFRFPVLAPIKRRVAIQPDPCARYVKHHEHDDGLPEILQIAEEEYQTYLQIEYEHHKSNILDQTFYVQYSNQKRVFRHKVPKWIKIN